MLVATEATDGTGKALAETAGLRVSTAHHLLSTLVAEGFLAQDERARYLLGPRIAVLASALQRDLTPPSYLLKALNEIVAVTGETAYLAAWRRGEIHLLTVLEGHQPVRVSVPLADYRDAHARASGKLFLAHLPEDELEAYLGGHRIRKVTDRTITSRKQLLAQLRRIREDGYALDEEEFQEGVCCISVPVLQEKVMVAAYSLAVPTHRFEQNKDELVDSALRVVAAIDRPAGLDGRG